MKKGTGLNEMKPDYTGKIRYRKNKLGTIVVEVEYRYDYSDSGFNLADVECRTAWRAATSEDLYNLKSEVPLV